MATRIAPYTAHCEITQDKTKKLVLVPGGRSKWEVKNKGEKEIVRHVGGYLTEDARQDEDTRKRVINTRNKIRDVAKAWSMGTKHGRGVGSRIQMSTRLQVMRAVTDSMR